jgi:hypothetical protein
MSSSITIYIQAHGFIRPGIFIPNDISRGCKILSFTGGIGRSGIMKKDCPGFVIPPPTDVELPENVELPDIEIDGAQIDIMALSYTQQVYTFMNNIPSINDNIKSDLSFDVVVKGMPSVYSNCGISRFPHSKISDVPFNVIPSLQDKMYQLRPNLHEDCVHRGMCSRLGCEVLEKSKQVCPYYGVYVVYSTNPEDIHYTLSGENSQGDNHILVNLNTEEGQHTKYYWENKIDIYWENKIDKAIPRIKPRLEAERNRITSLYRKMTETLGDDIPVADKETMEEPLPEITLHEVLEIFIKGMGYDEINIIDPSCDTCVYSQRFKLLSNKVYREVRLSRNSKRKRGESLGGKKMTKKRKSRKIRKHKTYKKRKHIKMSYK